MPTVVFYVSGHGFGHASRQIEVINTLGALRPDLRIVICTSAAQWLFELTLTVPAQVRYVEVDTGVVQIDGLRLDAAESIRRAAEFHRHADELVEREAGFLGSVGARLVIADIPPLAFRAAARRGLPAIAVANFTWDWIYQGYLEDTEAPEAAAGLITAIQAMYRQATLALRLPFSGGFSSLERIIDVPFIARRSRRDPMAVRRVLELPVDRPLVLVSFGGYGVQAIDWSTLSRLDPYGIVTTAVPGLAMPPGGRRARIFRLDERQLYGSGVRYEDLVAAVDVVATKPGYGIIAECIANDTAVLYTSRGRFLEYDVLIAEMPQYVRAQFIDQDDLRGGRWRPQLDRVLALPPPPVRPAVDGAEVVANYLLQAVS